MKRIITAALVVTMALSLLAGCGSKSGNGEKKLEGSCAEILENVYGEAKLDQEMRDSMESYENTAIDKAAAENILGTTEIAYTDSAYSAPMMNAIAYQCVLLRVSAEQDVEAAKKLLEEKADPNKWICVQAESVVVENVGDVILFIMADEATATAVKDAFLALK